MGCFQSKQRKSKAKPLKCPKLHQGQFNARWKRLLQTIEFSKNAIDDQNKTQHPAFRAIEKDLQRTLPNHAFFKTPQGLQLFRQTLRSYALIFPKIGYTQGLNFLTGFLLTQENDKEQCLNTLINISVHPSLMCIGLYEDGFPLTHLYCELFWRVLQKTDKELYSCLKLIQIPDYMWIFQWFLTFFIYSFPIEYIPFMFNFIFEFKEFAMVSLAVGVVLCLKQDILSLEQKDQFGFSEYLQNLKSTDSCIKLLKIEDLEQKAGEIEEKVVFDSLKELNIDKNVHNFYVKYFSSSPQNRKALYSLFISDLEERKVELSSSKHNQNLMQSYKRNRETVQILDQIMFQSIKRQKQRKYKSNVVFMGEKGSQKGRGFRKWKSLAQLDEDVKNQDETNISIIKKYVIPEEKEE